MSNATPLETSNSLKELKTKQKTTKKHKKTTTQDILFLHQTENSQISKHIYL